MRRFGIYLAGATAALALPVLADTTTNRTLSLEDCVQIALQHNLDVQIHRLNPDISRLTLRAVYGAYDVNFTMSGEHDYSQSPGGVDAQGRAYSGTLNESDSGSIGFSGLLPWGLSYSLGGTLSDTWGVYPPATVANTNAPYVVTNTFATPGGGAPISFLTTNYATEKVQQPFANFSSRIGVLQLRQPLLKNFWIDNTRLQIILDKKSLKGSELDFRNQVMSTVFQVEQAYYNLIYAADNVGVQRLALELAERLMAENKKRVEVGALAPLDEKQAESQVASSQAAVLSAEGDRDTQQRRLKSLLSDDYSTWRDATIKPTEPLLAIPETFDLRESWRRGLTLRPDLLQQKLTLEKQGYIVKYQQNQLYPQLDITGTYGYAGSGADSGMAFDQIRGQNNPFWTVGGQMTVPLGNTAARHNYRAAKVTKDQIALQLKQLQQNILITIENDVAVARTALLRAKATREARLYAAAALDAEQKKLDNGKSTSFVVLQLQSNLTSAQSAEIRALADYNIALAQLALDEGTTLERRHVALEVH